jgi:hypothetical protein
MELAPNFSLRAGLKAVVRDSHLSQFGDFNFYRQHLGLHDEVAIAACAKFACAAAPLRDV